MAAKMKASIKDVRELRKSLGINQSEFWNKFGVTQSGGSRYEAGRNMPAPLKILMQAWLDKLIDDPTLGKLSAKLAKTR